MSGIIAPLEDINNLKERLRQLESVRTDLEAVSARVAKLEQNRLTAGVGGPLPKHFQASVNNLDPALKRAVFIGFPEDIDDDGRISQIQKLMDNKFPHIKFSDIGNVYSGPYSNRKLTKVSYVEFVSRQTCSNFLRKVEQVKFPNINGKDLLIKQARTKLNSTRNYYLRKAIEIIKAKDNINASRAEIDWKKREIKIDNIVVFFQNKDDADGTFTGPCSDLAFP